MKPETAGVPQDWYCVAFDETRHWNLSPEDAPFIEKMMGVYIYDRSERTYCCEITPSHYMIHIADVAYCKADTPDDVRERISERYECSGQGEDFYMHCHSVKAIPEDRTHHYGAAEGADEVREYYQGNPVF